jgi:hypothetical protein
MAATKAIPMAIGATAAMDEFLAVALRITDKKIKVPMNSTR